MPLADFVHLRVHSAYSLSEGAIKTKDLVKLCQKHRMPAVAVTDTGNLFGALEFAMAAADAGIQPIIGCQLNIRRAGARPVQSSVTAGKPLPPDPLVLLVQTEIGYSNLMKLVSQAYLESDGGEAPQVSLADLSGRSEGLLALTGGPAGPVGRALAAGQLPVARETLNTLISLFPGRLYVELMRHGNSSQDISGLSALEDRIEPMLIDLAYEYEVPLVATNDCYFSDAGMHEAHDALLCIAEGRFVAESDRRRVTPEHRFKSAAEMRDLFADLPEAVENTLVIARRCSYLLRPTKPILPPFPDAVAAGRTEAEELRLRAEAGLAERLARLPEADVALYRSRLAFELGVIAAMKFPGYFLIVADFITWTKQQGIPVGPGRGSGAGSVVAWALTITDLDPLRFGLLFERFLNPERVSMPDFDIDFCQDRRDEVLRYVQGRYGHDRVAQIITFGKLQARAVLRDVGRVLQLPLGQVDRICKLVPNNPANPVTLEKAIETEPQLQVHRDGDVQVARMMAIAMKLEGLYRHASTHAAGVVIGDRPLEQMVALYRDPRSDMPVTQFSMKYVEQAGLVKFDFLGLKTLTVIQKAVELTGQPIDIADLPLDDEKTYTLLSRAETTGVFQLESSGMRDVLRRLKPNRFEDIIALVALYRPGPMDNIPKYIKVKNREEAADYLHPSLEGILKETFGIMIYQEQVMQIAQVLSGYTLGGADLLRRAMGKKIQSEMDAQRQTFVEGAKVRGVDPGQAGMIFDQVNKFAGYGFNKSHAAAYALVAYQTAWLKANHRVAFMAASMTLDIGNTDKLNVFRQELVRVGIKLLTPDINRSDAIFGVETLPGGEQAIRYALAAVKGVGAAAMAGVVEERRAHGPYRDIFDFVRRIDTKAVNKRQLENLARAGAFDGLVPERSRVLASVETLVRYGHAVAVERQSGQASLFGGAGEGLKEPDLTAAERWDSLEKLKHEFDAIGFYLSAHPLDAYAAPLSRLGVVRIADLPAHLAAGNPGRTRMAGVVINRQERTAKTGTRFAFAQLSDASGVFEVTLFQEVLAQTREILVAGKAVILSVDVQRQGDDLRLTCQEIKPLEEETAKVAKGLHLRLNSASPLSSLRAAIANLGHGKGTISILVELDGTKEVEIEIPGRYNTSPKARVSLACLSGVELIEV